MFNIILDKDKQEKIKKLVGEELYNNLYAYQKMILQTQISKKDLKRFKCIEEYAIKEKEKNELKKNNEDKGYT